MLRFDEEKLKKLFMEELRFSKENAEHAVERVKTFDERLQPILDQWMKD